MNNIENFYFDKVKNIHDKVYNEVNEKYLNVFLCGGASSKKYTSVRDRIRDDLNKRYKNIRILYPEDIFIEMLNREKNKYDLLSLEGFLADNCDIICIVCESAGSLVELGAFTNNDKTVDKVIALVEERRKRQKSFVMLGPIQILEHKDKESVIYYNKELEGTQRMLHRAFNKKMKSLDSQDNKINKLLGLYYFIPLILYFIEDMEITTLKNSLKEIFKEKDYSTKSFDTLFNSALKLLYKERYLTKNIIKDKVLYNLTAKGCDNIYSILSNLKIKDKNKLYDRIRFDILYGKYYRSF